MLKYFVTGGAGFIGREIVRQLLNKGHNICVYDDFSFGRKENLIEFGKENKFCIIEGHIEDYDKVYPSIKKFQPDIIVHLAAIHFIPYCNANPLKTIRINVEGTHSILEAATKIGIKRFLFASSGAIYKSEDHPLREDNDIPSPNDIYGLSKFLCEKSCQYYSEKYDISCYAMRFFNTYGPYETNPHLMPEIIQQLRSGNTIQLGNTETKRDYIYVEDIAKAVILLSLLQKTTKFETVNVGTGMEYSAARIVNFLSKIMNKKIIVLTEQSKYRKNDKLHQIASLNKLQNLIDWKPKYTLEVGLKRLLEWEKII